MTTAVSEEINKALSKAKIQLMAKPDSAFFTTLCFSLRLVWEENIPTAGTDGTRILFNPKFFMSMSPEERVGVMIHETMHVAYLHMIRQGARNQQKFNIAADHVINLQLLDRGFKLPSFVLADPRYKGMSTEQVYDLLPPDASAGGMPGDIMPGEGGPGADEAMTQEVQDMLVRASIQSKMNNDKPGTIPGDIEIFINGLLNPKLPWNRLLQKYLNAFAKNDYSFRKPNRRFFPKYHLPSLYGEQLMNLTVAVDTSGSVSDSDFKAFVTEVGSILRMMKPEEITLLQFDTEIKAVDKIKNISDLMRCKFTGRGGTSIGPVIKWVNENLTQLLLVFSDGEFNFYGPEAKPQTLWVIHNNERFSPPFGKTVHYSL